MACIGMLVTSQITRIFAYHSKKSESRMTQHRLVGGLISSIQANPGLYQISNVPTGQAQAGKLFVDEALRVLPIAWSQSYYGPVSGCAKCPGRLGYVIQPVTAIPGVFQITVRVTNKYLGTSNGEVREFRFLTALN
jgi:hypothetical protein